MMRKYEVTDQVAIVYDQGVLGIEDAKKYGWKTRTGDYGFSLPFVDYSPGAKNHPLATLGHEVHRIRALCNIPRHGVKAGDLGGFIETEANFSHFNNEAWIADDSVVFGKHARVAGRALVRDRAIIAGTMGGTLISGHAVISDESVILRGTVAGGIIICGNTIYRGYGTYLDGDCRIVDAIISSY